MAEEIAVPEPKLNVHISSYDLINALRSAITTEVQRSVNRSVEELVRACIERTLRQRIEAVTDELIREQVKATLEAGWQKTSEYGEPLRGAPPMTLSTAVRDALVRFEKPEGGYRDSPSKLQTIISEIAQKATREGLTPIVEEAKNRLRTELDLSIGKSLRLTIADAIKG